jgi:ribosomal-protein-alanine N-acetyltransferase
MRRFGHGDMGEILEIENGAFPKTAYSEQILLHYAGVFPETFVVACTGGKVVGYIIFDAGGHVISMAIKEGHRNKGFGKTLIMYALEHARSKIWLEVRTKNQGAIAFYRSLGMETVGKIPGYYGNDDALIMARDS